MQNIVIPAQTDRHAKCIERSTRIHATRIGLAASLLAGLAANASADAITDWNVKAGELVVEAKLGPPPANRVMAMVHAAVYEAVNAITGRYPAGRLQLEATQGASVDAAVAAANHATLAKLMPSQQASIDAAYQAALATIADGPAKTAGIAVGQKAAAAIRRGDIDGNDATERDASWTPFIDAPMHPEYPSAHSILAGAVGAVLQAEIGAGAIPALTTTSPTAKGAARRWTRVDDFVQEVVNARVYQGVHYRFSAQVGAAMGKQIGELAAAKVLRSPGVSTAQVNAENAPEDNHPPTF